MRLRPRIVKTLVLLTLSFAVPLMAKPSLLIDPRVLFLMAAGITMLFSQPDFSTAESGRHKSTDRLSILAILLAGFASQALPVIEWAYFGVGVSGGISIIAVAAGAIMVLVGLAFRIWSIRTLGRFFTSTVQIVDCHRIVKSGPYRIVRHPSYTGAYIAMLGSAVLLQAPVAFLISGLFLVWAYHKRLQAEEEVLIGEFGKEYEAYRKCTPALVPELQLLGRRPLHKIVVGALLIAVTATAIAWTSHAADGLEQSLANFEAPHFSKAQE